MSDSTDARRCVPQASHLKCERPGDPNILPPVPPVPRASRPGCAPCPSLAGPLASPTQPARRMHRVGPRNGPPNGAARAAAEPPPCCVPRADGRAARVLRVGPRRARQEQFGGSRAAVCGPAPGRLGSPGGGRGGRARPFERLGRRGRALRVPRVLHGVVGPPRAADNSYFGVWRRPCRYLRLQKRFVTIVNFFKRPKAGRAKV